MSTPLRFLVADSFEHAEVLDGLVCEYLRDIDGNRGSRWSGVWSDGLRYGIVWPEPFHDLYDTESEIVENTLDEDGEWLWWEVPPPEPVPTEELP